MQVIHKLDSRLLAGLMLTIFSGAAGAQEVSELINAFEKADLGYGASRVLVRRGGAAVPLLKEALNNGSDSQRLLSAYTLGEIGGEAAAACLALRKAAQSDLVPLRAASVEALGKIAAASEGVCDNSLRLISQALADQEFSVRESAVAALSRVGPKAAAFAPSLVELLKEPAIRSEVRTALESIGEPGAEALIAALDDRTLRWDAIGVLRKVAPQQAANAKVAKTTADDIATLCLVVMDPTRSVAEQKAAAKELARLKGDAWQRLADMLDHAEAHPAGAASAAAAFGAAKTGAVPLLLPKLQSPQAATRLLATTALQNLGDASSPAAKALAEMFDDPDHDVRLGAVRALDAMGPQAAPAVDALIKLMLDEKQREPARQWAILALVNTLPKTSDKVMPALIEASQNKINYGVRSLASQQVKKFQKGTQAKSDGD